MRPAGSMLPGGKNVDIINSRMTTASPKRTSLANTLRIACPAGKAGLYTATHPEQPVETA
jgi:hypothetical protein